MLILKGVMLLVSEPVHCEEHEVHHVHPMMCSYCVHTETSWIWQWFFQRIFWIFWQFHSFTYNYRFLSNGFWTMELKHDFLKIAPIMPSYFFRSKNLISGKANAGQDLRKRRCGYPPWNEQQTPLKIGAPWKRRFLLEITIFRGELLVVGSVPPRKWTNVPVQRKHLKRKWIIWTNHQFSIC